MGSARHRPRRRKRRALPVDVQRLQCAAAGRQGSVPAILPESPGHEPRRGRRDAGPRRPDARPAPRRRRSTPKSPATACAARHTIQRLPSRKGRPWQRSSRTRSGPHRCRPTQWTTSTRMAPPLRKTIRRRLAASVWCSAREPRRLPVTSIKSMIGHCLSAAGAIEAATLALSIARGIVPPTVNLRERDPALRRGRRRQRGTGCDGDPAACRRRSRLGATTRRSSCAA